jgi:uncharacterized protein (TIGR00369 family)
MDSSTEHFRKLERMYHSAPINKFYDPKLRIERGRTELVIPIRPEFFHAARAAHGSVYFKALDDAAFFAVNSLVEDVFVLTANFTLYLLRPIDKGAMIARGVVTHESQSSFIAEATLVDQDSRQIARGSGSFVKSRTALTPDIGYL